MGKRFRRNEVEERCIHEGVNYEVHASVRSMIVDGMRATKIRVPQLTGLPSMFIAAQDDRCATVGDNRQMEPHPSHRKPTAILMFLDRLAGFQRHEPHGTEGQVKPG
jgi:hypothetical protein